MPRPHPNEQHNAQIIAEQVLAGSQPGAMATWGMSPEHVGRGADGHPYGPHIGAGYVRGDGSIFGAMLPPG